MPIDEMDIVVDYYGESSDEKNQSSEGEIDSLTNLYGRDCSSDCREKRALLQAIVFVEDAISHRSIHHKVDTISLKHYRMYHSKKVKWLMRMTIVVIMMLAFFERPSSLTLSSAPSLRGNRYELPCGITEAIEVLCLILLTIDVAFKVLMVGYRNAKKSRWLMFYVIILVVSYLDWIVSLRYSCNESIRVRRLLRPFFLLQNSSLMKKTVQSIQRSIPEILSVLFLFCLHLYFFTMCGMLLFSPFAIVDKDKRREIDILNNHDEGYRYFNDLGTSIMSLVVLLTTANNPDVMMPAYRDNRFYAIYFIVYLSVGSYFFMNMLLAAIYTQFKGSFTRSLQSSFFRRRVGIRAAFEVLRGSTFYSMPIELPSCSVSKYIIRQLIDQIKFSKKSRYYSNMIQYLDGLQTESVSSTQFQKLFDFVFEDAARKRPPVRQFDNSIMSTLQRHVMHPYFQYFGDFISVCNVLFLTVELSLRHGDVIQGSSMLKLFNFFFIMYYGFEQTVMIVLIGPRRYFSHKHICFQAVVTLLLVFVQITYLSLYGGPFAQHTIEEIISKGPVYQYLSMWNLLRCCNMLIIIRLLRIIRSIKALSMVAGTLFDLMKNMKAFGGVIISIFYVFAIFGMIIFQGKSPVPLPVPGNSTNVTLECGTYEQLDYYANNFDDFAASVVVLWDIMIVNNWHVFLDAYKRTTNSRSSQLFFILWWLVSVVLCMNLLVALVLEAFTSQYDFNQRRKRKKSRRVFAANEETTPHFRVHEMFRHEMREPTEGELLAEIKSHHHLQKFVTLRNPDFG